MNNLFQKDNLVTFILISFIPLTLITGPAIPDISVSLSCIIFLYLLFQKKIEIHLNVFFYFTFAFWFILLFLNINSINFSNSIIESIIFIRILLIPIIMYFWIFKSSKLIKFSLFIILIANLIVILDSIYQFLNYNSLEGFGSDIFSRESNFYGRLSGPFLDLVPGSYISKFFIFGFICLTFAIKKKLNFYIIASIYLTLCGIITFISGERMALATFCLGMLLLIILIKKHRLILIISFIIFIITSYTIYKSHDFYQNYRIIESKPTHLGLVIEKFNYNCEPNNNCSKIIRLQPQLGVVLKNFTKTAYHDSFSLAYEMFEYSPFSGIGFNNFNYGCLNLKKFKRNTCWSHPHNFYIQFLTETGLVGLSFFLIYILIIFKYILVDFKKNIYSKYSFTVLVVIFWPLMSTGSLLKNWHGIQTFFIIGLCLSILNLSKNKNS